MSEETFEIFIDTSALSEVKALLDFYEKFKNGLEDRDVINWFGTRSDKAVELLKSTCNSKKDKTALLEGLFKPIPGFDLAWVAAEISPLVGEQYWYPEWCKNLSEVIEPNSGFLIIPRRNGYRVRLDYMHSHQAPITAIFLARLFMASNFELSDIAFSSEYEDD